MHLLVEHVPLISRIPLGMRLLVPRDAFLAEMRTKSGMMFALPKDAILADCHGFVLCVLLPKDAILRIAFRPRLHFPPIGAKLEKEFKSNIGDRLSSY